VPPSQRMPDALLNLFVQHLIRFPRIPQSEVLLPASQFLIQPVAHLFPQTRVGARLKNDDSRIFFFCGMKPSVLIRQVMEAANVRPPRRP